MLSNTSYIEVARSILESRELALGPHSVTRLELRGFPGIAYLLNTGGLVSNQLEFLTLFATPPTKNDLIATIAAAKNCGVTTTPICVAPKNRGNAGTETSGSERCDVWEPVAFFEHLVALPDHFLSLLRNVASVQRINEFSSTFQEREAIVHVAPGRIPQERTDLADYLREWLSAPMRSPILLLGERGTGKSWQLLQFVREAYKLNHENPWLHGLAFFVRLSELVNLVEQASAATPVLPQYVLTKYPDVQFSFGGVGLLGALLRIGHSVVCVDGFDEMDMLPSDSQVRARLTGLLLLLSKSTRFVLTCRPGHFTSLSALFAANTWGTRSISNTFEVLELLPFDRERKLAYIRAAAPDNGRALIERLGGLKDNWKGFSPLQRAVSICAQHPGFLAHMTEIGKAGKTTLSQLIETSIRKVFLEFNVLEARTSENYQNAKGNFVDLSVKRRMELLADIAWYMAERQLPSIDLANLPPRIRRWYEIEDDALERDLRSQTVFELVPEDSATRHGGASNDPKPGDIQWPDSLDNNIATGQASIAPRVSLARFTLRTDEKEQPDEEKDTDVGESSVCGCYFLAKYIAARMQRIGPFGSLEDERRLRFLGRVKLGSMTASLLREMLDAHDATCVPELGTEGWRLMRRLATEDQFRIYSPWLRYLASNLAAIGALSPSHAMALDPWTSEVSSVIAPPFRLPEYDMALVPPPATTSDGEPFLLGVHEITNEQVRQFLWAAPSELDDDPTVQGQEWRVSRMTIAGTGKSGLLSPNSQLSNEYHLFAWMPTDRSTTNDNAPSIGSARQTYLPPNEIRRHPATYVSWYAAAAFCDWLSNGGPSNGMPLARRYLQELNHGLRLSTDPASLENHRAGYRLPTKTEWTWAARGGHEDIERPWELFPFYLPTERRQGSPEQELTIGDHSPLENFDRAQDIMRRILMNSAKNQTDVLYDEPNDFGVSGLMGNVREWCDDEAKSRAGSYPIEGSERLILGATGYLGDATFAFDYATPLYPRNTNPDVGFRIARSLQQEELMLLQKRQTEIATLPELPKSEP